MDRRLNAVVVICFICLTAVAGRRARETAEWRAFAIGVLTLSLFAVFLNRLFGFPFASPLVNKAGGDINLLIAMAISLVLGMVGQYLYRHFERPKRYRPKWDWGCFVAPIFAAPIILIPLAAAFQNADIDLKKDSLTVPRMMIFLGL